MLIINTGFAGVADVEDPLAKVTFLAEATDIIPSAPERVYAVLADYHTHHPAILPKPAFKALKVIKGGTGAGTEFEATVNEWGREQVYHHVVSEPEPGRVLREIDQQKGVETTFTVEPVNGGQSLVTITVKRKAGSGLLGASEMHLWEALIP